jgi:hypothetical protein
MSSGLGLGIAEMKSVAVEIGVVDFFFIGVDVVCEDDFPGVFFEGEAYEADAGEEFGGAERGLGRCFAAGLENLGWHRDPCGCYPLEAK